jgi:DNA polymerase (family 10)
MKKKIAMMFRRLATFEAMVGKRLQSEAYKRASDVFFSYDETVFMELLAKGRLVEIEGIGNVIASLAYQVRDTGRMSKLDTYEADIPINLEDMLSMRGIGPKTVYRLYRSLGVKCKDDILKFGGKFPRKVEGISTKKEKLIFEQVGHKESEQIKLF